MQILGALSVRWADEVLQPPTRKAAAALAWLAAQPRPASREALAALLWGEGKLRNVRQALYRLRKLPGAAEWLVEDGSGALSLRVARLDARQPPAGWGGELLEGLAGLTPAFDVFREDQRLAVLERWAPEQMALAEAELRAGAPAPAAARLDRVLALLPEAADALALRQAAASALGDAAGALRARSAIPERAPRRSLYADRLARLLAVTTGEDLDWPEEEPALPPTAVMAEAIGGDVLLLADALAELERDGVIDESRRLIAPPAAPGADAPLLHRRLADGLLAAADAEAIRPALIGWHLQHAGDGQAAARQYLADGAGWALERALSLAAPGLLRAQVLSALLERARQAEDAAGAAAALSQLGQLAQLTQSLPVLAVLHRQRAHEALRHGAAGEAVALAGEAIRYAGQHGDPVELARARVVRAAAALRQGRFEDVLDDMAAARGCGEPAVELQVLNAMGAALALSGRLERAVAVHEAALRLARQQGELRLCVRLLNNLGATAERQADYARSAAAFAEVVELGEQLGDGAVVQVASLNRAQIALLRGRLGEARSLLRALPGGPPLPNEAARAWSLRGQIEQRCGRWAEARERLQRALDVYARLGAAEGQCNLTFSLACVEQAAAPGPAHEAALQAALDGLAAVGAPWLVAQARMEAVLLVAAPERLEALAAAIAAERADPHGVLLAAVARARAARLRGAAAPPAMPAPPAGLELAEAPDLLALCAHAAGPGAQQEALAARARAAAAEQAAGLLSAQREALLARVAALLPV